MNPYEMFNTDADLEQAGIKLNYGSFWLYVKRAGGANKKFGRVMEALMRPHRRLLEAELLDEKVAMEVMARGYAQAIVTGWGCEEYGEGQMVARDGGALDFTEDNVCAFLQELPELFQDVQAQCRKMSNFRTVELEADAKN